MHAQKLAALGAMALVAEAKPHSSTEDPMLRHPIGGNSFSCSGGFRWAAIAAAALFGNFGYPMTAAAQSACWTTVGSAGTVDEADLAQVALSSSDTAILPGVLAGTVDTRYNVVAVPGIFGGTVNSKIMTARIADNGPASRVVLRFIRQNFVTGVSTTLATLDSNSFTPSAVAQARSTPPFNTDAPELDFRRNFYLISATLSKLGLSGNPVVRGIQICPNFVEP